MDTSQRSCRALGLPNRHQVILVLKSNKRTNVQAEARNLADTFACLQQSLQGFVLPDYASACRPPVHLTPQVRREIPTAEDVVRQLGYNVKPGLRDIKSNALRNNGHSGLVKVMVAEPQSRHRVR